MLEASLKARREAERLELEARYLDLSQIETGRRSAGRQAREAYEKAARRRALVSRVTRRFIVLSRRERGVSDNGT